jgi:hypothetical protein
MEKGGKDLFMIIRARTVGTLRGKIPCSVRENFQPRPQGEGSPLVRG